MPPILPPTPLSFEAENEILEACREAMIRTQKRISDAVYRKPDRAFEEVRVPGKDPGHVTTRIDQEAERMAAGFLRGARLGLKVEGEETPQERRLDLDREHSPVAIVDMIDGTDLFTRELGNWCSAMVVLHPPTEEILGALVGLPLGDQFKLYMAGRSYEGAKLLTYDISVTKGGYLHYILRGDPGDRARIRLTPQSYTPRAGKPLDQTSICFYGQKRSRLIHLRDKTRFPWHGSLETSEKLRIYTLAGNPMLAKLAEGRISGVFEAKGQKPYDCVPGLFIALKAGAAIARPDGSKLNLGRALKQRKEITYVAGCNERLLKHLAPLIG